MGPGFGVPVMSRFHALSLPLSLLAAPSFTLSVQAPLLDSPAKADRSKVPFTLEPCWMGTVAVVPAGLVMVTVSPERLLCDRFSPSLSWLMLTSWPMVTVDEVVLCPWMAEPGVAPPLTLTGAGGSRVSKPSPRVRNGGVCGERPTGPAPERRSA